MTRTPSTSRMLVHAWMSAMIAAFLIVTILLPANASTEPSISSFSPTSGPVGTMVTINGTNFADATSVRFDGKNAPGFGVNGSGTQITVAVPNAAHTGKISVTTPNGADQSGSNFTVTGSNDPVISGFSPSSGAIGTSVTITGDHFTGVSQVKFSGTDASFSLNSDTQITAFVPNGARSGRISVTTPSGTDTSATSFTVVTPTVPKITGFSPHSGTAGTSVSIFGSGFFGVTTVRFNNTAVASFALVTDGKITTVVPGGATSGPISVTNPQGTASSGSAFTVTGPGITSFYPTSGYAGTSVTITGSNFTGVNDVRFNGMSASFAFVSDTRVTVVVPNGATTGRVTLTTPSGTATSGADFTVIGVHQRSVSLSVVRWLSATGRVSVNDGYAACQRYVPVVVKRFRHGHWRWVTTTSTREDGTFRAFLPDRPGRYRARAQRIQLVDGAICGGAGSNVVYRS